MIKIIGLLQAGLFVNYLFTNIVKIQQLIQQVFNVSKNGSFFTDLLDFVGKNRYYLTATNSRN